MIYSLSGDIYEGNYKDDLFDGEGHYIYKNSGQEYRGEYKNGLMHGKGLYEWSEGEFIEVILLMVKKKEMGKCIGLMGDLLLVHLLMEDHKELVYLIMD